MSKRVDINADIGESYGNYRVGDDENLMNYVTSVSIACGFHAGDPNVMEKVVRIAVKNNLNIGAHPGFPDLLGFGRRFIEVSPSEIKNYVTYQLGALSGFLRKYRVSLSFIKPHGALYRLVETNEDVADSFIEAVNEFGGNLSIITEEDKVLEKLAIRSGIKVYREFFPDLRYDDNGNWIIERQKKESNVNEVYERAIEAVSHNSYTTIGGKKLETHPDTLCIHGDSKNCVDTARFLKEKLASNNIDVMAFSTT
jgi:UPF0271 protein